jgi:hypothetical protein
MKIYKYIKCLILIGLVIISACSSENSSTEDDQIDVVDPVNVCNVSQNVTVQQLGSDLQGQFDFACFGAEIAINASGSRIIVGSPCDDEGGDLAGKASVFEFNGTSWIQIGSNILGKMEDDNTATGVSINSLGDIIGITGFGYNGNIGTGHARVYQFNGSEWQQKGGDILPPSGSSEQFGSSLAMDASGNRIILGVPSIEIDGVIRGGARVFDYNQQTDSWEQVGDIVELTSICEYCTLAGGGNAVSMSDDGMIISLSNSSSQISGGGKFVIAFRFNGSEWSPIQCNKDFPSQVCNNGSSFITGVLSDDGTRMIIGDPIRASNSSGFTYFLDVNLSEMKRIDLVQGEILQGDFGHSVGINNNGTRFVIYEAYSESGSSTNKGQIYLYQEVDNNICQIETLIEVPEIIDNPRTSSVSNSRITMSTNGRRFALSSSNTPNNGSKGVVRIYEISE